MPGSLPDPGFFLPEVVVTTLSHIDAYVDFAIIMAVFVSCCALGYGLLAIVEAVWKEVRK